MTTGFYNNLMTDKYVLQRLDIYANLLNNHPILKTDKKVKVVDIGGYMGDFYEYLKSMYPDLYNKLDYTILDFDDDALKTAYSRGINVTKVNLHFDDISKVLPVSYDIVICTEVLEHVLDPRKILKAVKENMSSQSLCIISLPNENTIFHRIYSLIGLGPDACAFVPYGNHKHFHLPTITQSRNLLTDFLKIEKEDYYINMSGIGSHFGFVSNIFQLFPDSFWNKLAHIFPNFFARGSVWLLSKEN